MEEEKLEEPDPEELKPAPAPAPVRQGFTKLPADVPPISRGGFVLHGGLQERLWFTRLPNGLRLQSHGTLLYSDRRKIRQVLRMFPKGGSVNEKRFAQADLYYNIMKTLESENVCDVFY